METLKYTSDANNLLQLECFPSIRLDKGKYALNGQYWLQKGSKVIGKVQCVRHQHILMRHITDSLSYTITGKAAAYMQGVLRKQYPTADWQRDKISYMHFKWVERYTEQPETPVRQIPVQTTLNMGCNSYQHQ